MSSILVLLGLLSVATLFARRGYAAFVAHIVTTPLLVGLGVLIAPHNLAFLTPSTTEALEPAMRVATAWIALLVAMRGVRPKLGTIFGRETLMALGVGAFAWLALSAFCFGFLFLVARFDLGFMQLPRETSAMLGVALLMGGIVSTTGLTFAEQALKGQEHLRGVRSLLRLARHDELAPALALCVAVWLWPAPAAAAPAYEVPWLAAGLIVVLGLVLAVAQLLAGGEKMGGASASFIALVGLITFGAGLAASTRLPEAAIAFFLGSALAFVGRGQAALDQGLAETERPVRLVLLVLIGANLGFHPDAIVLGIALSLARFIVKGLVRAILTGGRSDLPMSALLGSAGAALPFALSFALSRPQPLVESKVLVAVAVSVCVTDLLTLAFWRRTSSDSGASAPAPAAEPGTGGGVGIPLTEASSEARS